MSTLPDEFPPDPEEQHLSKHSVHAPAEESLVTGHDFSRADAAAQSQGALAPEESDESETTEHVPTLPPVSGHDFIPADQSHELTGALAPEAQPRPLFDSFAQPEIPPPPPRIPHFGHFILLGLIAIIGLLIAGGIGQIAIHYHLFGVTNTQEAVTEIHYTLGSEAILYVFTLIGCLLIFPFVWHRSFFEGISWNGATARRLAPMLAGAAFVCFLLALLNGWLMPGPPDAPIDKMFRVPGAAWLLFGFGITLAPFFEELAFRGFLLPSLCTACDWTAERFFSRPRALPAMDGAPQWSLPAMIIASILTSIPFAGMHAAQTGNSLGPFLLLLGVSLVLCAARLITRSLAASVTVHACYNFMLFSLMLLGTSGFRHLENM